LRKIDNVQQATPWCAHGKGIEKGIMLAKDAQRRMTFATGKPAQIVKGRECGRCSLCCKVVRIDEIGKPPGQWCKDCAPGRGCCKIYENRPEPCRHFLCMWLFTEDLGPDWFPATAKLVVSVEQSGKRIAVLLILRYRRAGANSPIIQ
jgi:hypothetical protein